MHVMFHIQFFIKDVTGRWPLPSATDRLVADMEQLHVAFTSVERRRWAGAVLALLVDQMAVLACRLEMTIL